MTGSGSQPVKGVVLACGRYGCVVRLADGRIANLPPSDPEFTHVRRAAGQRRRPELSFVLSEQEGSLTLRLASDADVVARSPQPDVVARSLNADSDLDEKIIGYLRQTEDWDPNGAIANRAQESKEPRADRLLPFEMRARRQYRDSPKKPPRKKR